MRGEIEIVCPHCENPNYNEEIDLLMDCDNQIDCYECNGVIHYDIKKTIVVTAVAKTSRELQENR